jgi:hypothetical protein
MNKKLKPKPDFTTIFITILMVALVALYVVGVVDAATQQAAGPTYERVVVEGMDCLIAKSVTSRGFVVTSITCDWGDWGGQ